MVNCIVGEIPMWVSHIVESCPLIKFGDSGLWQLHLPMIVCHLSKRHGVGNTCEVMSSFSCCKVCQITFYTSWVERIHVPYILAYKPTIFGWIFTIKLWGSAYTWVMPHSHTLAARVSTAWTISRPLGLHVCMEECVAGGGTKHILLLQLHTS